MTTGNQKAFFKLSNEDLNTIESFVNKNDFLLKSETKEPYAIVRSLPVSTTAILIVNGENEFHFTYCSPCRYVFDFSKVKKTQNLVELIEAVCAKDENVKKLPTSDFYLE